MENGICNRCGGTGVATITNACSSHGLKKAHYYCISNTSHGNDVSEYH